MDSYVVARRLRKLVNLPALEEWPTPDEGALSGSDLDDYLKRKRAITFYLQGGDRDAINEQFGFGDKYVYRMITERCIATHPDGQIYGWRAIVPRTYIKPYVRKCAVKTNEYGRGASGALNAVLDSQPELRKRFERRVLNVAKTGQLGPVRQSTKSHWRWFIEQLRTLGYEVRGEWPFNTASKGYQSIWRYVKRILVENPARAAEVIGGPNLKRKLKSGDGVDRPVTQLFERVEMDAHKLDGRFCVMLPQMMGGEIAKIIHRIWVIVIIEVISRAVLGYHLSFRREVSKEDVLRAIKNALTKWQRRPLTFGENVYVEGAGFPGSHSDAFLGVCWNQTSIDGALAEKAKVVREALKNVVNSSLVTPDIGFSSRRSLDDRPYIEAFFRTLGKNGFQRISNTTGSNVKAKQGRDPDEAALAGQFQLEYAEELLDVLIANYNASGHSSLGDRSPLAYLDFLDSRADIELRRADTSLVSSLLCYRKLCQVRGGHEAGRRPYVNFSNAQYSSDVLAQRQDLVGKSIWVANHIHDDARVAQASTNDGKVIGILRAAPPWHKLPHTLEVRGAITSCIRRHMFSVGSHCDAVEMFLDFVENQPHKKLPVHPAYLEARRVLVRYTEALDALNVQPQKVKPQRNDDATVGLVHKAEQDGLDKVEVTLPARRLAAVRK